jgi:signal transduction histidine kinase
VAIECRLQRVRISVTDAGPGLEPEQCEQIRQRWARGPAGVSLGAGVGLGLAIASRYAALMKGTLELNAGPDGRGLCAVLELRQGQLDRSS